MSTKSKIHQAKLNEWAVRFADQKSSGLTVPEWCRQNNLTTHKYFYWKRLLKEVAAEQMLPDIVPIVIPDTANQYSKSAFPTFPPLAGTSCTTCSNAKITINDISIDIDSSSSEAFIQSLIKAVRNA